MKKIILSFLLASCLMILGACDITEQLEQSGWSPLGNEKHEKLKEKPLHYVALGDSLTEGVGDEAEKGGYVGRLAENMKSWQGVSTVTVSNTAKKGRRSDQLLEQLKSGRINDVLQKATVITLTMGGNDLMKVARQNIQNLDVADFNQEIPAYQKRYEEIFRLIRKQNKTAPIIAMGVYNPFTVYTTEVGETDDIMKMYNDAMKQIVEEENHYTVFVPVADLFVTNEKNVYHTDYFHPNAKGYDRMTERIIETLRQANVYTLTKHRYDLEEQDDEE